MLSQRLTSTVGIPSMIGGPGVCTPALPGVPSVLRLEISLPGALVVLDLLQDSLALSRG